jgi:hypothetical protein
VAYRWDFPPHLWDNRPFRQSYHSRSNNHNPPDVLEAYFQAHFPYASPPRFLIVTNLSTG